MVRPFVFILPSLLLGCVTGIFVGRALPKSEIKPLGHTAPGSSATQVVSSGSGEPTACRIDYDRLATACARGANKGAFGVTGSVRASTSSENGAQAALEKIEERATEEGVWSQYAGFKAEALVRKLPQEEAQAFGARIAEKIRSGVLELQEGAWLPQDQQK